MTSVRYDVAVSNRLSKSEDVLTQRYTERRKKIGSDFYKVENDKVICSIEYRI